MFVQIPDFPMYLVDENGVVVSMKFGKWKVMTLDTAHNGYLRAMLCDKGKRVRRAVHRCVLAAFVGPLPEGMQVNHKNGIKTDNRLENLEYCTPKNNTAHAFENNLRAPVKGEKHHKAKLSDAQVIELRRLKGQMSQSKAAALFGIAQTAVGLIWRGERRNV